jgi:hypothetical protein
MARRGFLNDTTCLPIKDRASVVVRKNIKLYIPLVANGVTSQVTDCDYFVHETSKGIAQVGNV